MMNNNNNKLPFFSLFALALIMIVASSSMTIALQQQQQQQRSNQDMGDIWSTSANNPSAGRFDFFDDINSNHERLVQDDHPQSRAAKSLAIDCASFDPCPPHGFCLNGGCVCDAEPLKGFWAGSDCKECADGWAGVDCNIECAGGSCNQCSSHGTCNQGIAGDGTCTCVSNAASGYFDGEDCGSCRAGYFGEKCDKSCPGADVGALPCYGRGECYSSSTGLGLCRCVDGYGTDSGCQFCDATSYGPSCEFRCAGYIPGDEAKGIAALACSGHGQCFSGASGNGTCKCDPQYGNFDCSKRCPSDDARPCSGHGECFDGSTGNATCSCSGNFAAPACAYCTPDYAGPNCTALCPNPNSGGKEDDRICSLTGTCVAVDEFTGSCSCQIGYRSSTTTLGFDFCDIACPGSPPCSGHGDCEPDPTDASKSVCKCFADPVRGYWTGPTCDRCTLEYNHSNAANCTLKCPVANGRICNGQGYCAYGRCYCNRGVVGFDYCGDACELASAPGAMNAGQCERCTCVYCTEKDKYGPQCTQGVFEECPGMTLTDPIVPCNGHGRCDEGIQGSGKCQCYLGYAGFDCGKTCPHFNGQSCGGGGRGFCNSTMDSSGKETIFCDCIYGFAGPACELECPRVSDDVCAGHGKCRGDGTCDCDLGWTGKACNVRCACNTDHGNCDHQVCYNYSATQTCSTCVCNGNFTNLCDICEPGTQGVTCEGLCVKGYTKGRECICDPLWATPACNVSCPRDPNGVLCGGKGNCTGGNDSPGTCTCETNTVGQPIFFGAACTVYCTVDLCKSRGFVTPQCNVLTGDCECKDDATGHWFGPTCSECKEGFFGAQCAAGCQCSDNGGCDKATGVCQCFQDSTRGFYSGSACDVCTDGFIGDNCERANVLYTRIEQNITIERTYDIPDYRRGRAVPTTNVFMMDERLDIAYGGSFPMIQLSNSIANPGNLVQMANSSTEPFKEGRIYSADGNYTEKDCYDEVAYTFVHEDFIYFLMHPQMQCNLTTRILQRNREDKPTPVGLDFKKMTKVYQMPPPKDWSECKGCDVWGNRTSRIIWADSISETKQLSRDGLSNVLPGLTFILGQPNQVDDSQFDGGGLLVRVDIGALGTQGPRQAVAGAMLPTTFIPRSLAVRPRNTEQAETSEIIAVSGEIVSQTAGDTWEVLLFSVAGPTITPDPTVAFDQASLRRKVECFQVLADKTQGQRNCIECLSAPVVDWFGQSLAVGMNTPDSGVAAWFRPMTTAFVQENVTFHFPFADADGTISCHPTINADMAGSQIMSLKTGEKKAYNGAGIFIPLFADSKIIGSEIRSMVVDEETKTQHYNMVVLGKQSYMIKFIMTGPFSILGVFPLDVMSALTVTLSTKTKPEEFSRLVVDEHARILYGTTDQQSELRLGSFLLYDVLSLNPNLADQRGGTVIQVVGHGFKKIIDPTLGPTIEKVLFPVKCMFGGEEIVPANFLSNTLINCTTGKVSEEAAVSSCEGQTVEVTLYGTKFFTDNKIPLKRVQAARIEGRAYPDLGPLGVEGDPESIRRRTVTITGTGFVDSPFAKCKFYSNNTDRYFKPLLPEMIFINVTAAKCVQPVTTEPSPKYSFIDVSLDGQLFMETTPPFYTIVGNAANISAPLEVTMPAKLPSTIFTVSTQIVDKLGHWVGDLDKANRTVCITAKYMEASSCIEEKFYWRSEKDQFGSQGIWPPCRANVLTIPGLNTSKPLPTEHPDYDPTFFNKEITGEFRAGGATPLKMSFSEFYCRRIYESTGEHIWNDLEIPLPRSGIFVFFWISSNPGEGEADDWILPTKLVIVPGTPYALEIFNRRKLESPGTFANGAAFQPFPEIVLVDEVGNIIENPPPTVEITVRAHYLWDHNGSLGGYKDITEKKPADSNFITFRNIFPTFMHGAVHYFNFTSRNPSLKMTRSPPLRTELCPNIKRSYKIPFGPECGVCPPAGAECFGNETVILLQGFWRGNSTTDIYECPGGDEVCLGSYGAGEGQYCKEGYEGPLCNLCIEGWGKVGATSCQPCPPLGTSVGLILLVIVAVICALTGWTISVLRQAEVTDLSVVMRTIVNHMQATGKLGEFQGPDWGPVAGGAMDSQSSSSGLSFSGLSAISCLITQTGGDYEMVFTGYMMLPMISFVMAGLVLCAVRILKLTPVLQEKVRADIIEEVKNMPSAKIGLILEAYPWYWVLTTTFSLNMFVLYQTLITEATAVLSCTKLVVAPGVEKQYLTVDMSIPCDDSGNHKFITAAYIGAIAYGFGIPSAFVFAFKFMGNRIGNKDLVGQMFMFLIGGYKPDFWYWQAVIMVRKLILVLVITFISDNPQLQSYAGMWTMLGALMLQIWFEPNERDSFNRVETLSLAVITLTLNLGLLFFWKEMPNIVKNLAIAVLVLVTLGVFVMFGYFMYEPIRDVVVENLAMVKDILAKLQEKKEVVEDPDAAKRRRQLKVEDLDYDEGPATSLGGGAGAGGRSGNAFGKRVANNDVKIGDFAELEMSPRSTYNTTTSNPFDNGDDVLGIGQSRGSSNNNRQRQQKSSTTKVSDLMGGNESAGFFDDL